MEADNKSEDAFHEDAMYEEEGSEMSETSEEGDAWFYMPDSILLAIFQYLSPRELVTVGEVCKSWNRVSKDEFLWKDLLYRTFKIDSGIGIVPG